MKLASVEKQEKRVVEENITKCIRYNKQGGTIVWGV